MSKAIGLSPINKYITKAHWKNNNIHIILMEVGKVNALIPRIDTFFFKFLSGISKFAKH